MLHNVQLSDFDFVSGLLQSALNDETFNLNTYIYRPLMTNYLHFQTPLGKCSLPDLELLHILWMFNVMENTGFLLTF